MAEQLSFDLPAVEALGREDFFVSPANAMAVAMIEAPQSWVARKLLLSGPEGSGKTHLTHVWAARAQAVILPAQGLAGQDIAGLATGNIAVEDIPRIAQCRADQEALFHLHNLTLANGHHLLLTGSGVPRHWGLSLADLQSRLEGTQMITLSEPDDQLLAAVLAKLFRDRQIIPRADVIPYLLSRADRSFAAAAELVDRLDALALSEGRNLTGRLARQLLGPDPKKS